MKITKTIQIICLILLLIFSSCAPLKMPEFLSIEKVSVNSINLSHSVINVELKYFNPNNVSLVIKETNLDVYINNSFVGHSAQLMNLPIPNRASFVVPLQLDVDNKNLLKNAVVSVFQKDAVIKVVGTVKLNKGAINKTFPIDFVTKQNLSIF